MNPIIGEMRDFIMSGKAVSDRAIKRQADVFEGRVPDRHPLYLQCTPNDALLSKIPVFNNKEIHYDTEKMLIQGMRTMLSSVAGGADAVPSMRANMGCGIFAALLGLKQDLYDDKMPWLRTHLDKETLSKMGPEDLKVGDEFKMALDHMAAANELLRGTGGYVYPLDLQGAFDTAHLIYGDRIFYDLYDDPVFVHHLMDLSVQAIIMGMEECFKVMSCTDQFIPHYNTLAIPRSKGGLKLSEDTSTLVGKDTIDEFIIPYLRRILEHFGGGYVHYCGHNDHLYRAVMNEPLVSAINFGNPEKHDMDAVLRECTATGKLYYGGFSKRQDETYEELFNRLLSITYKDGKFSLLCRINCTLDEKDDVLGSWDSALAKILPR